MAPRRTVTLGATALSAMLGRTAALRDHRGAPFALEGGATAMATVHPAYLLRLPDETARRDPYDAWVADLRRAAELAGAAK